MKSGILRTGENSTGRNNYDTDVEEELVECLYRYVLENKKRFR